MTRSGAPRNRAEPFVIMFGWDNEIDIVVALEVGADDDAVLPCPPREMRARVLAALRRLAMQKDRPHG